MSVNRATILGRLGADPDVRSLPSGQRVATLSVATNMRWTGKNGEKQDATQWHRVILWGRPADVAGQYLKKGREVYIEGRIQTREWKEQGGQKRYTTEIIATNLQLIGSAMAGESETGAPTGVQAEGEFPPEVEEALAGF